MRLKRTQSKCTSRNVTTASKQQNSIHWVFLNQRHRHNSYGNRAHTQYLQEWGPHILLQQDKHYLHQLMEKHVRLLVSTRRRNIFINTIYYSCPLFFTPFSLENCCCQLLLGTVAAILVTLFLSMVDFLQTMSNQSWNSNWLCLEPKILESTKQKIFFFPCLDSTKN